MGDRMSIKPVLRLTLQYALAIAIGFTGAYTLTPRHRLEVSPSQPKLLGLKSQLLFSTAHRFRNKPVPFTLVEFGDYQCPPCINSHKVVKNLLQTFPELDFIFRELPLVKLHRYALESAQLSESTKSERAFWSVHDELYGLEGRIDNMSLRKISEKHSLSRSFAGLHRVSMDLALARRLKIDHTPTFFLCFPDDRVFELGKVTQVNDLLNKRR